MKIEKGTKLIAIDPCEMEYENYGISANVKALIVGKEYVVMGIKKYEVGEDVVIQSEISDEHYFRTAHLKDYFTFHENTPDSSL